MRILFLGTSAFAVSVLNHLINSEYEVAGVVTQPDRPKGRGRKVVPTPVKELAHNSGLDIFQPASCKNQDFISTVSSLEPDFLVTAAYGQILPKDILTVPRHIPINVHASLLPRYRGAAPIQWAIINADKTTGVTTMVMDEGMDTGDILLTAETAIAEKDTAGSLNEKLAEMGGGLLVQTLDRWLDGSITRHPQDNTRATYAPTLTKEDGHIRFDEPARIIEHKIRGLTPWPGAYTVLAGKRIKILEAIVEDRTAPAPPGKIVRADGDKLSVACSDGVLSILRLQMEGKKPTSTEEFLRGLRYSIKGEILV
jgi:methionyl-tRNA formyltransferase